LKVDEAALTGESEAVYKTTEALAKNTAVADQTNMVFKGTHIVRGGGIAVIVATGLATQIGVIAREVSLQTSEVPLKANIEHLSRMIMWAVAGISVLLFVIGIALGKGVFEMFTTVVSLAVSVIPEGLPIVLTLVLASGVWRMSKRYALVKKLQAVEALGQARVIAVDKTGTITKNELVVQRVYADGRMFSIGGVGYEPTGDVFLDESAVEVVNHPELLHVGKVAALNSNARVFLGGDLHEWQISGDPQKQQCMSFPKKLVSIKMLLYEKIPCLER
jgi:cation-transporting ATPase F